MLAALGSYAQVYNNEWIDYSKTYYKFKVGKTGLHRINHSVLSAAGLGATPAEHFQLWRNGVEVPIYTSVFSGSLSASDYIEFWGEMNDGKPDKALYRNPNSQLNNKWSLETDTAAYFLTVNTSGSSQRIVNTANNVAGNTLSPEPYFMYTAGRYFRDKMNQGYAVDVGEYLYSSSYDRGEGWTSSDIGTGGTNSFTFSNLFPAATGPDAKFKIHISGNSVQTRTYKVNLNGTNLITGTNIDYFNFTRDSVALSNALFSSGSALVEVVNAATVPNNRMVVHQYELTYARLFNFGGASNFEFTLLPSAGNYLEITGFAAGSAAPVLYDLTNKKRYVTEVSGSVIKVVLQPSAEVRNLVLVNAESTNFTTVAALQSRNFVNYSLPANAADYLIISNPLLFNTSTGINPIEEYRQYRSSANGGGYNAKTFLVDDLADQFAFGIKKHPLSIRNFVAYARNNFPVQPKHVFLIGKGLHYIHQRAFEANPDINKLHFVPTFGWPASDVLLTAEGGSSVPKTPIGRLSVINGDEVRVYLQKVIEHESNQRNISPLIKDKAWMKNVVHIVGASEPGLQALLDGYMKKYTSMIQDTLFGANVTTFTKTSASSVEQINSGYLNKLFEDGITLMTYFGHSSSGTLEFNLNNPDQYNNQGKYPLFVALGCNAGNFYNFATDRLSVKETLSEKYVLAANRGTIGFIASSHFGIVHYLDISTTRMYQSLGVKDYGKSIGEIMQSTIKATFNFTTEEDFYARANAEETSLHGDPAITLNPHPKPDYAIEDDLVKLDPTFVSIADTVFNLKAKFLNIGKAINKSIVREVRRTFPDGSTEIIFRDTIPGIRYADSLSINIPINALRDKGSNKLTVTIDADSEVDEIFETNNSITKEVIVYEDEIRPVYPYNFAIVNKPGTKFYASTANPFSLLQKYRFEIDTTERFNSGALRSTDISSTGGVIEFSPLVNFMDSTVYYWRVGKVIVNAVNKWNTNSLIYKSNIETGFNQSHFFQHQKSTARGIYIDSLSRQWKFKPIVEDVFIRHGTWASSTGQEAGMSIYVNGSRSIYNACMFNSLVFVVFDPVTFQPWANPTGGLYGSGPICYSGRQNNFEFQYTDTASRRKIMEFMKDIIPSGYYVIVRNFIAGTNTTPGNYGPDWAGDTALYGKDKSAYHYLKNAGFGLIDSFTRVRPWAFIYKKDDPSYVPKMAMGADRLENITLSDGILIPSTQGYIQSPVFGPAAEWKTMRWLGNSEETTNVDKVSVNILGTQPNGKVDTLFKNIQPTTPEVDISSVNPVQYPYLSLYMENGDAVNRTPYQLKYWQLTYKPKPEGAVAPNILFTMRDTLELGESINFKMAFKNISEANFDSLKVKMLITDRNNITHVLPIQKLKPLVASDTVHVSYPIDSKIFGGMNILYVEVNPDNDQPELHHFNNFIYKNFYVAADTLNPLLDVTFDNAHILNGDIVSAKPEIVIQLKDEAKWRLLDDTSLVSVSLKHPDGSIREYRYDNDTLKFEASRTATSYGNAATVRFKPHLLVDGDYELIVQGQDKSANKAGAMEYRVSFQVINKAMISNLLNYPNPFTSSTAFVFKITGSAVPDNIKIQILTVNGKVVKEIKKEELGTLRVGTNITEYKWNGTDEFGQKLANGIYLYRVITTTNGSLLEKYRSPGENTDKYFNNGYGKMYLLR